MEFCKTCNNCACISYTEKQQLEMYNKNIIVDHVCRKHGRKLFHYSQSKGYNPMIYPCAECNFDDYSEIE